MKFTKATLRITIATTVALIHNHADAFAPIARGRGVPMALASSVENLPDLDELKSAPFMKQVQYGGELTEALMELDSGDEANQKKLRESLSAQLSHSDGIRGFMVSYLTGSGEDTITAEMIATEQDPQILLETVARLLSKENSEDLVSLMCMNVVMPIAMITMHQDPALSEASRLTAARGIRLLGSVVGASSNISQNLEAIQNAAQQTNTDNKLVEYWINFFGKWGYEEAQTKDIAAAVGELLSKSSLEQ